MATAKQHETQFKLRIPEDRLDWVKNRAQLNNRTVNAEVNFILSYYKFLEEQGNVPKVA